ncbi:MAG TPA: barstar family protein [Burkholderiales bacterium]|nr:barstar family protein [Burkholderiales bacterium]
MKKAPLPAPALSGAYHAPAHVAAVRESLERSGARWVDIDLTTARTKAELMAALGRNIAAPADFGHNWDALADVLQDLSWQSASAYVLHVRECAAASRALGRDWATLLEILAESAMYWKRRRKPFVVLVDDAAELPPWI